MPAQEGVWLYWEPIGVAGDGDWYVERSLQPDVAGHVWLAAGAGAPSYSLLDTDIAGATQWYYRVRQTNTNGDVRYSEWRLADLGKSAQAMQVFPNPSGGQFTVAISLSAAKTLRMDIVDAAGRVVWHDAHRWEAGLQQMDIAPVGLAQGIYMLRVVGDGMRWTQRLVVE